VSKIKIKVKAISNVEDRLLRAERELESLETRIRKSILLTNDPLEKSKITKVNVRVDKVQKDISEIRQFIRFATSSYNRTEGQIVKDSSIVSGILSSIVKVLQTPKKIENEDAKALHDEWEKAVDENGIGMLNYKDKKAFKNHKADYKDGKNKASYGNMKEDAPERKGTIIEVKDRLSIEDAVIDEKSKFDGEYASYNAAVKVGKTEVYGEFSAGMYVYDNKGNKYVSPGVKAEVGLSMSIIEASADGRIGLGEDNNLLGVYGDVKASAGTAEAKAGVVVGLIGEDGKVDINAKASASAGIYAAEIEGAAGIAVAGVDVGVTGSLNVGLGASADIGIHDGKFKCEIGASLGIGFKVGFEIDAGGFIGACIGWFS